MPHPALSASIARVGRAVDPGNDSDTTDGRLLTRFVRTRDEAAFAELVRRLGPMVLGVCRRVTADDHHADDAFQAAFVVLARRAADVRPAEAVRGWLYGVAVRTARGARSMSARRNAREALVPTLPDRPAKTSARPDTDTLRALDEEIAALPEHLRSAVVLCELDGLSRKDAAARLGIPEGTLSSRLGKARKLLATALQGRGVTLAAGFAALVAVAVPAPLLAQTTASATAGGALAPAVATLSNGVLRMILVHKLKAIPVVLSLLAATLAGGWLVVAAPPAPVAPPTAPLAVSRDAQPKTAPVGRKPVSPNQILVTRSTSIQMMSPEGKVLSEVTNKPEGYNPMRGARLSPDGALVAAVAVDSKDLIPQPGPGGPRLIPYRVTIGKPGKSEPDTTFDLTAYSISPVWAADGKSVIATRVTSHDPLTFESSRLVIATGKIEPFDAAGKARVLDAHQDGKTFLVAAAAADGKGYKLSVLTLGDANPRELTTLSARSPVIVIARFSPDGKTAILIDADPTQKDAHKWGQSRRPYLVDVATGKRELLPDFPENGMVTGITWSPDGKHMAYAWELLNDEMLKKDTLSADDATKDTESFLVVADADGKNPKTIATEKASLVSQRLFGTIDWR